ncbi:MAG: MucR family transcriptional regulator [Rickettsiales bacterium]|nr:MucR family transcriptional regulator [Rickettsiales bacterium]
MSQTIKKEALVDATAQVVSAMVNQKPMKSSELAEAIQNVYRTFAALTPAEDHNVKVMNAEGKTAEVNIDESVQPDYIICLEDGKKLKMLKRYLKTNYGMSPEEYRKRWNLPSNYPMVAPEYAKRRSMLAKKIGLGKQERAHTPRNHVSDIVFHA